MGICYLDTIQQSISVAAKGNGLSFMRSPGQVSYILSALRNLKGLSRPKHLVEGIFSYHVLSDVNFILGGEEGKIFHEKNLGILSHNNE